MADIVHANEGNNGPILSPAITNVILKEITSLILEDLLFNANKKICKLKK